MPTSIGRQFGLQTVCLAPEDLAPCARPQWPFRFHFDDLTLLMPTSKPPDKPANLDDAFAAHHRWKMELRHAVGRGERLDIAVIKNPGACELGRWLKSEDAMQYAHLTEFKELVKKHDEFHAVTALVASVVNGKDLPLANAVINGSNHFSRASLEVGMAIQALRNAVA